MIALWILSLAAAFTGGFLLAALFRAAGSPARRAVGSEAHKAGEPEARRAVGSEARKAGDRKEPHTEDLEARKAEKIRREYENFLRYDGSEQSDIR